LQPLTSATAFCTAADFILHHGSKEVAVLACDVPGQPDAGDVTDESTPVGEVVALALRRASGEVEMACLVGGRYKPADLLALLATGGVTAAALSGLTSDLAFWHLSKRRHPPIRIDEVPGAAEAYNTLELLRSGEKIFGFDEVIDAYNPKAVGETPTEQSSGGYTSKTPRISDGCARRYFGVRGNRGE
jgi:hypothetical protein